MASKKLQYKKIDPSIFEETIIKYTVNIMVPLMSFIGAFLYYQYYAGFNIFTRLANWIKLICLNFPFAYVSQIYLIQPLIRWIFKYTLKKITMI